MRIHLKCYFTPGGALWEGRRRMERKDDGKKVRETRLLLTDKFVGSDHKAFNEGILKNQGNGEEDDTGDAEDSSHDDLFDY